jgi:predicted MFS family arabinose efflux permease
MIVCDVGAAVVLGLVPCAAWAGFLSMGLLYLVAALTGISRVFFNVAYQSTVPDLVQERELVGANARLSFSSSASELAGPSVAGFVLELVRPAVAVLADAGSFVFSALTLAGMARRPREPGAANPPAGSGRTVRGVYRDVRSGLSLLRDSRLRSLVLASATLNFSYEAAFSVLFVFAYRRLGLSTGMVGLDFALGGLGSVLGSVLATRMHTLLGFGRSLVVSLAAMALSDFLMPAAVLGFAPVLLGAALFIFGFFLVTFNVGQLTLRQRLTPKELLGRMNATFVTLLWSAVPVAFVLGGALGSEIGLVPTLLAAAGLSCTAPLWLSSPLRGLRDLESATQQ